MSAKLYSALALLCALASNAQATELSGPVDFAMVRKAVATRDAVEITSPGGSMLLSISIAQTFRDRGIPVRVTGWCASGCAMIAIGSGRCTVARSGRLALHAPVLPPGTMSVTDAARQLERSRTAWMDWMHKVGVPYDILDATVQAYGQRLELSDYGMKRVGCTLE